MTVTCRGARARWRICEVDATFAQPRADVLLLVSSPALAADPIQVRSDDVSHTDLVS